ncbi:spore germination protein [Clostridiisalibacter paucivorans]|uniref:spore germination protein n=1 Tax=Clostridiisalibacter paucivorans TaxID=408753 RepID=UPI00047D9E5A|nr:spore germination protein [Clostridiisalibacter paucivorans]
MKLSQKLEENKKAINNILPIEKSFDIIDRDLVFGDKKAYLVFIDGFAKDDIMLWLLLHLQELKKEDMNIQSVKEFIDKNISYIEVDLFEDLDQLQNAVLSGAVGLVIDGENKGIIIDARTYPARGPEEPDLEKVTRGSRDGLVETIIFNTALIRRRIRDENLIFEMYSVGKRTKSDIVISYIDDIVDKNLLNIIKKKLNEIDVDALVMGEKSLEELLIKKKWYNPIPQARFSERPDVVSAHLLEGHIAIIVDTSPSALIVPVTMFHFTQHAEDYYQNPSVGTYLRWVRYLFMCFSLILSPLWFLLVTNNELLPEAFTFLGPKEETLIPIFIQFVILEIGLDGLRLASIHTPNTLSTSLSIIGGLLIGELAIKVGWLVPETILYMVIVSVGTFITPSIEFSMAIRMFRLLLLLLTGLFNIYGFIGGIILISIMFVTTKNINGQRYTWPLIPFDKTAFGNILLRKPIIEIKRNNDKK